MNIPIKYETQLDYQYMQPLFLARKKLTDKISDSSQGYSLYDKMVKDLRMEITELDNLILKLAGKI